MQQEFQDCRALVERLEKKVENLKGQRETLLKSLQEETGAGTVKEAQQIFKKMKREEQKLEREYEELRDEFQRQWRDVLDQQDPGEG